jgi:isoprenylcysteine carboxyl methyltransferase (ICMT) family protein YpbQ
MTFEAVTDWIAILAVAAMLGAAYASWLASYRAPKAAPVGSSFWFSLPVWAQIAVGFATTILGGYAGYLLWIPLPLTVSPGIALFLRLAGLALVCGGAGLWFWARWTLGAMMGVSTSSAAQLHADHRLIQHGPYALVRHPMYLGYWLVVAGLVVLYRTWTPLVILILILASLSRRARREEQALESAFGGEWRAYAARVPMFAPRRFT